jgi:microcin C transport system substrate-binding protein
VSGHDLSVVRDQQVCQADPIPPRHWARAYDIAQVREGRIRRFAQRNWFTVGMNGIFYNLRSPLFGDRRVREALALLYDFEWANRVLFHDGYARTQSYFLNTDIAATEPPDEREIAELMPFRNELPEDAFSSAYQPPRSDGSGRDRANLERAFDLLTDAGWRLESGVLRHTQNRRRFAFAVMAQTQNQQLILGHWFKALERVGIAATLQVVDSSVYNERLRQRQFDTIQRFTIPPAWPGAEQQTAWRSDGGPGGPGHNLVGLRSPLVDHLVDQLAVANDYAGVRFWGKLLDRALQWQFLAVPGHYEADRKVAVWDRIVQPSRHPHHAFGLDYWWSRER